MSTGRSVLRTWLASLLVTVACGDHNHEPPLACPSADSGAGGGTTVNTCVGTGVHLPIGPLPGVGGRGDTGTPGASTGGVTGSNGGVGGIGGSDLGLGGGSGLGLGGSGQGAGGLDLGIAGMDQGLAGTTF